MTADRPNVNADSRYSVKQAAAIMNVSESTARAWYRSKSLARFKVGYLAKQTKQLFYTGRDLMTIWNYKTL